MSNEFHQKIYEKYRDLFKFYIGEIEDNKPVFEKKVDELNSLNVLSHEFNYTLEFFNDLILIILDRVTLIVDELIDKTLNSNYRDLYKIISYVNNSLNDSIFDENDEESINLIKYLFVTSIFVKNQIKFNSKEKKIELKLERISAIIESELLLLEKIIEIRKILLEKKIERAALSINIINNDLKKKQGNINLDRIVSEFREEKSILELNHILFALDIDLDLNLFFKICKLNDINIDDKFLLLVKFLLQLDFKLLYIPYFLDFVIDYIKESKIKNVLIPWFLPGVLNFDNSKFFKEKNITALVKDESLKKLYSEIYEANFDIKFIQKKIDEKNSFKQKFTSIEELYHLNKSYDLIIGVQEQNKDSIKVNISSTQGKIPLRDYVPYFDLLAVCANLKDSGVAFFILDEQILLNRNSRNNLMNLDRFDLYIDSILKYQPKIINFTKKNLVNPIILVIKKNHPSKLFVAELTMDQNHNNIVLNNLKKRKYGKIPSMGYLTSIEDFFSFKSFYEKIEYDQMIKASKFDKIKFKDIELSFDVIDVIDKNMDNSLYFINSGLSRYKVITTEKELNKYHHEKNILSEYFDHIYQSIDELDYTFKELSKEKEKMDKLMGILHLYFPKKYNDDYSSKSYKIMKLFHKISMDLLNLSFIKLPYEKDLIRIDIDPEKASADYIAKYLNSEVGQKLLNSLKTKQAIDLDIIRLMDKYIAIPNLEKQNDVLRTDSLISDISLECDSFMNDLWKFPQKNKSIKKSVELFYVGKRMGHWIESLPFPLSSILTSCGADSDVERRVRYLIHFFEAFSEFNATIILSAIIKDKSFCRDNFNNCLKNIKHSNWIYKPSFGNWNYLGNCFAKKIRILLNDKYERKLIFELFKNPNQEFLNVITNKDLYNIFQKTVNYRNEWIGHGPPVNMSENQHRFDTLVELLSKTRKIVDNVFEETLFIKPVPESMSYDGEIYSTKVKKVVGITPTFKDIKVETTHSLNHNNLYMYHSSQYEALELLPFFKIMPGPKTEQNACYFYNRYNANNTDNEVELISYHFEQDHTASAPYKEFKTLISLFDKQN